MIAISTFSLSVVCSMISAATYLESGVKRRGVATSIKFRLLGLANGVGVAESSVKCSHGSSKILSDADFVSESFICSCRRWECSSLS